MSFGTTSQFLLQQVIDSGVCKHLSPLWMEVSFLGAFALIMTMLVGLVFVLFLS